MASVITVKELIELVAPAQKSAPKQAKREFPASLVEKYKARLIRLQEQAKQSVPPADERTLNIRFDS